MIEAFLFFLVVMFLIPSLLLTLYALAVYRILRRFRGVHRLAITLMTPALLSTITALISRLSMKYASLFGTAFMAVFATQVALGMIASITPFEKLTSERQRTYMFISFSVVMAIIFLWGFSSVMGTPPPTMDFMHFVDYRSVLKLGRFTFRFISSFLVFAESAALSLAYFSVCYAAIRISKS